MTTPQEPEGTQPGTAGSGAPESGASDGESARPSYGTPSYGGSSFGGGEGAAEPAAAEPEPAAEPAADPAPEPAQEPAPERVQEPVRDEPAGSTAAYAIPAAATAEPEPEPVPVAKPKPDTKSNPAAAQPLKTGKTRRARLVVRRIDPWSVLKFALLFSLCLLIVFVVAVAALYYALDALGVFESLNQFVRDVTQAGPEGQATGGFDVTFEPGSIIGGAAVLGAINVVIITAISTLGAFLYNLCSDIVGGIEVTLAERN